MFDRCAIRYSPHGSSLRRFLPSVLQAQPGAGVTDSYGTKIWDAGLGLIASEYIPYLFLKLAISV